MVLNQKDGAASPLNINLSSCKRTGCLYSMRVTIISAIRKKGFELVYIVLNESTWEGRYTRNLYLLDILGCNSMKIETCMGE